MNNQVTHWERLSVYPIDASVIDPGDRRGHKNRYITQLRNEAILSGLNQYSATSPVLDFGCGTGGLSSAVAASGRSVLGVDISSGLLKRTAERQIKEDALFVQYDGARLPFMDGCASAAVTYVVLNHILDESQLLHALREIHRVLRPGGSLVAVEQVCTRQKLDQSVWQCRRTISEFKALFAAAGFESVDSAIIRYGRFPLIYAVRQGWIPETAYARLHRLERWLGSWLGVVPWDYCDVKFTMKKNASGTR